MLIVLKCSICGIIFTKVYELEEHRISTHNFMEQEFSLLKRAKEQEKARKRTRGPYRKAHAA